MGHDDRREGEEPYPPDTRPFLTIPYWTAAVSPGGTWDRGTDRPLPGAVVSYLCESIRPGPYTPGQPLDVVVHVRNSGGGNSAALATVVVYWADPTVGFAKPNFLAATAVAVPPSRNAAASVATRTMTATIPASAPTHVCLLAAVSHPQDRAGTACDPVGDRHWAQRNLQAAAVAPGAPAFVPFVAANPFEVEASFELLLGPADERHVVRVAREFGTEPVGARATLRLLDEGGAEIAEPGPQTGIELGLGALEQRRLGLLVEVEDELPPNGSAPLQAILLDRSERERVAGSLGVVLLAP
jgi:hypothetical protein